MIILFVSFSLCQYGLHVGLSDICDLTQEDAKLSAFEKESIVNGKFVSDFS